MTDDRAATEATAPSAPPAPGSEDALRALLAEMEALVCTRDWNAWQYRTMRDDDFVQVADDPDLIAQFVAWRDEAIDEALRRGRHKCGWCPDLATRRFVATDNATGETTETRSCAEHASSAIAWSLEG